MLVSLAGPEAERRLDARRGVRSVWRAEGRGYSKRLGLRVFFGDGAR